MNDILLFLSLYYQSQNFAHHFKVTLRQDISIKKNVRQCI